MSTASSGLGGSGTPLVFSLNDGTSPELANVVPAGAVVAVEARQAASREEHEEACGVKDDKTGGARVDVVGKFSKRDFGGTEQLTSPTLKVGGPSGGGADIGGNNTSVTGDSLASTLNKASSTSTTVAVDAESTSAQDRDGGVQARLSKALA